MPVFLSPGVYDIETDLSQVVQQVGVTNGALSFGSLRGRVGQYLITSAKAFTDEYGTPNPSYSLAHYTALDFLKRGKALWCNRVVHSDAKYGALVYNAGQLAGMAAPNAAGITDPTAYPWQTGDQFLLYPLSIGTYAQQLAIKVVTSTANPSVATIGVYSVSNPNVPLESHTVSLNMSTNGYGQQQKMDAYIAARSKYIRAIINPGLVTFNFITAVQTTPTTFIGGANGTAVADSDIVAGWNAFSNANKYNVNILINGGYATPAVQNAMDALAQARGDAIAVLDMPPASYQTADALTYRNQTLNLNSSYSALYSPGYQRYDEYNDIVIDCPPSGAVAAAMAFTDYTKEAWFAPAGLNRGVIQGAQGVTVDYEQGDTDQLYPAQINPILDIGGQGVVIWGQKTLQAVASALQSINVRRLLIVCEKSMAAAVKYAVFEPNDPFTQSQVTQMLNSFLGGVQSRRGLYYFKVVCDSSNNTPDVIDQLQLNCDVYLQPTKAAEFIKLQSVITRTGASVTELIATGGNF